MAPKSTKIKIANLIPLKSKLKGGDQYEEINIINCDNVYYNSDTAFAGDKVTIQLKWVTQAQFAGYYVAKDKGFYDVKV